MKKILCISDTHSLHQQIKIPEGIDIIIHAGDSTNYYDLYRNEVEFDDFLNWYSSLNVPHKVLTAGNHDASLTKKYNVDKVKDHGIVYNEHGYETVAGLNLFLSAYTPTFGNWHFMKDRSKLDRYWQVLEEGIDILVTHGPARGMLDLSRDRDGILEFCGDGALLKHIFRVKPKYHVFGHLHDGSDVVNHGIRKMNGLDTIFMNVSAVEDGKFGDPPKSNGITISL